MTAQISKSEQDERGLLPYPVIIAEMCIRDSR